MKKEKQPYKVGKVALVGRPNVGKSTLLNALVGQKVAIVTPKPQTTQSQIEAFYEDERGQIFFLDTPGYFSSNRGVKRYNFLIGESVAEADVIVFVVDKTRDWGEEDERVWVMVQAAEKPTILVINKMDMVKPDYTKSYEAIIGEQAQAILKLSAAEFTHLKGLINQLFTLLPAGERNSSVDHFVSPLLSQSSGEFLAELVREKIYLTTGEEVPYQTRVRIHQIRETEKKLRIDGEVVVAETRYKPILIGKEGRKIRQVRMAVEKELRVVTNKEVEVHLMVEVDE
jgi:GTPase